MKQAKETLAINAELLAIASPEVAKSTRRFFKTSPESYGAGDIFIGIGVPVLRKIAKKHLRLLDCEALLYFLNSEIHEFRLFALLALVIKFELEPERRKKEELFEFYVKDEVLNRINNWDLVDVSAYKILGAHLISNPNHISRLYELADSNDLWRKRISIVATLAFIRVGDFEHTKRIAVKFLVEKHDLLHKATGWMLREMGKKDESELIEFLKNHHTQMPKLMLSYAVEKLSSDILRNCLVSF